MERSFDGKVAIVTGAGRGLGRSHALALAGRGARVVVNDAGTGSNGFGTDNGPARDVALTINGAGADALADTTDISDWDAAESLVRRTVEAFGKIDILVNNAGVFDHSTIETITRALWERTIAVNLSGTAAMIRAVARQWRSEGPRPGRRIVNTSSPAGTHPVTGAPDYCASKAGVAALTMSSAMELAELGVRINALAPMARTRLTEKVIAFDGIIGAPIDNLDRMSPSHASAMVLYLSSEDCAFTGRVFAVDGDDAYMFNGYSADHHLNNRGEPWTQQALASAFASFDRQDRGYAIASGQRYPGPFPTDETFEVLDKVARREEARIEPMLVTRS